MDLHRLLVLTYGQKPEFPNLKIELLLRMTQQQTRTAKKPKELVSYSKDPWGYAAEDAHVAGRCEAGVVAWC